MTESPAPEPVRPDPQLVRWAHQGGAKEGPSNTLEAIELSLAADPGRAIECDVHLSSDGRLVVIHDRTVDATTDRSGRVRRMTCKELSAANAGHWWVKGSVADHGAPEEDYTYRSGKLGPVPIPTLEKILDCADSAPITIEIKSRRAVRPTIDLLAGRQCRNVTVTAFADWIVWLARLRMRDHPGWEADLAPGIGSTLLFWLRVVLGFPPRSTRYARLQIPDRKVLTFATPRVLRAAQSTPVRGTSEGVERTMRVDVWTIDDPAAMRRLIALGVDGIMTDVPSVLFGVALNGLSDAMAREAGVITDAQPGKAG